MKKKVKLILVPHNPEKWEVGMLVLMKGQLCKLIKQWLNKQKWERKIQPVEPYLISAEDFVEEKEYNDLVASFDGTNWIVFKTNVLLPSFKEVIATPDQIGLFSFKDSEPSESSLNMYYIHTILNQEGICEIETEEDWIRTGGPRVPGKLISYGKKIIKPKLINSKVIIHL